MSILRRWGVPVLASLVLIPGNAVPQIDTQQDPYQVLTFCTPVPAGRRQVTVTTGAELQRALDQAAGGDTILLAEDATFRPVAPEGSFMLRNRQIPSDQWVTIRSANHAFDASGALPPSVRAGKDNANVMPKLRAAAVNTAAIRAESGARGYRLIGLDIGVDEGVAHCRISSSSAPARTPGSKPSRPISSSIAVTCMATTAAITAAASR